MLGLAQATNEPAAGFQIAFVDESGSRHQEPLATGWAGQYRSSRTPWCPVSWGTVHDAGCQPECLVSRKTGWRGASAANAAPGLEGVTSKYGPTTSLSCRR